MSSKADTSEFVVRPLAPQDVDLCVGLSSAAGWNQTELDWQFHLGIGRGIGLWTNRRKLIATGVVLPAAERVGWIAMVLVSEDYRRRGLGRMIMGELTSRADYPCLALDATDQGSGLYEDLGFRSLERIIRYRMSRDGNLVRTNPETEPASPKELPFRPIARALANREDVSVVHRKTASALLRPGRLAYHIGPLAAGSEVDAFGLVGKILDQTEGNVLIDAPARLGTFTRRLERIGFTAERDFDRMARGGSYLVDPGRFAIAGPEYG